jgi:hypothetical protein
MISPYLPNWFQKMSVEIEAGLGEVVQVMLGSQIWSVHGWQ